MNEDKGPLRAAILSRRADMSAPSLATSCGAVGRHVISAVRGAAAARICAYVPVGTEPGSLGALNELVATGIEVLLPVLRNDLDLDWARYEGAGRLAAAGRGLREPVGVLLGVDAIADVEFAIVPALAVDGAGNRLGRGGGSYDRALARVPHGVPVTALLHDGELIARVPAHAHDRRVTHTISPLLGWRRASAA